MRSQQNYPWEEKVRKGIFHEKRNGFTLVDLLVVIAIIALLMALLCRPKLWLGWMYTLPERIPKVCGWPSRIL